MGHKLIQWINGRLTFVPPEAPVTSTTGLKGYIRQRLDPEAKSFKEKAKLLHSVLIRK